MKAPKNAKHFIKTKLALAKALGVARPTLDNFLVMPGAPGLVPGKGYELAAIVDFIAEHADTDGTIAKASTEIRALKAAELRLKCDRLKVKLDTERGRLVDIELVKSRFGPILQQIRDGLYQRLEVEMPMAVAGMDVPQSRIYGKRLAGDILTGWQKLVANIDDPAIQQEPKKEQQPAI